MKLSSLPAYEMANAMAGCGCGSPGTASWVPWVSRARREVPEASVGAHGRGSSCGAASARPTLLLVAALVAGTQVLPVTPPRDTSARGPGDPGPWK